jgi:hypothetical protein
VWVGGWVGGNAGLGETSGALDAPRPLASRSEPQFRELAQQSVD